MSSNELVEASSLRPQDFESIRDAVLETPRGRWFLNEYANRLRGSETVGLLDSMKRLESAVTSNHDALMSRLAEALTRENSLGSTSAPPAELAPKHMKFFKQDEDIFEPAPQARIAAVPEFVKPAPRPEVQKGARVVIRRSNETISASIEVAAEATETQSAISEVVTADASPSPQPEPLPQVNAVAPPEPAEAQPKRRIVIIRHKPGENIDVPLQNEMAAAG